MPFRICGRDINHDSHKVARPLPIYGNQSNPDIIIDLGCLIWSGGQTWLRLPTAPHNDNRPYQYQKTHGIPPPSRALCNGSRPAAAPPGESSPVTVAEIVANETGRLFRLVFCIAERKCFQRLPHLPLPSVRKRRSKEYTTRISRSGTQSPRQQRRQPRTYRSAITRADTQLPSHVAWKNRFRRLRQNPAAPRPS